MLALLVAFTPSLSAFAPTDDVYIGVEPARTWTVRPAFQGRLGRDADWVEFQAGEGSGWTARFDELTGTAHRAWGPGIPMGTIADAAGAERAVRAFLARNPGLVGVSAKDLRLRTANHDAGTDTWYVELDRLVSGAPVWRGGVTARIRDGRLVLFGADTYPDAPALGEATLTMDEASAVALAEGPAPDADHVVGKGRLVALPLPRDGRLAWHLAWEVSSRTTSPPGKWVSFVDARTGELLSVHNEVRFFSGTLYGEHDTRTVDGSLSTSAMPYLTISGSSGARATTALDGTFTASDAETWTARLSGSWLTVTNQAGGEGSLSVSGTSPTWTDAAATQAEIDSWVFLHHVRDWAETFAPALGMLTDGLTSNVNLASTCNAYYDGSVNFYQSGDGCNNTGRIADVAYHEWGHGFHYYSLEAGTFDGTMSEGIGDVVAVLQTLDPTIAPYFMTNGAGIRELETDYVYPDDVVNEVHYDGLIFGGAVWDLLGELQGKYGETATAKGEAWTVVSRLLTEAIKAGPTLDTVYDEFILADDTDGDPTNGSPHLCEIVDAFSRHGLGAAGGSSLLAFDHEALGNQAADVAIPIDGSILNLAPTCVDLSVTEVELSWSTDDGDTWESETLTYDGTNFEGAFPAFPSGTVVSYYLTARNADGTESTLPATSWAPYTFYVGALQEVWCEDFSAGDGGFTHELFEGSGEGADDWQFGAPAGMADDPDAAFTGTGVWGNDLGGGRYNGEYQSEIQNRLSSPAIDLGGLGDVIVQYRRWLNVEDGIYDVATLYADDEEVWSNHGSSRAAGDEHTQDAEWMLHTVRVAAAGETLTLGWELESDGGLEFGGWNIDDVCVYAPSDPNAWFTIRDFDASDDRAGEVALTWTQPDDARATQVIVVRRDDRFPETADDGRIVFTADGLSAGMAMSTTDPLLGDAYYTVFTGSDEVGWTSGAHEGANADVGAGLGEDDVPGGGDDDGGIDISKTGCGCAAPAGGGGLASLGVALAALAAARRRR